MAVLNDRKWQEFLHGFPDLGGDARLRAELKQSVIFRDVPPDEILYRDGDECTHLPLVLSGEVMLTKYGDTGRAITLYRVEAGESCILSTLSILNSTAFPAEASAHGEVSLVLVPSATLRRLVAERAEWRDFVFGMYQARLASLIALIEEVVFGKLDVRLARTLVRRPGPSPIHTTHQELAVELGSSREVVSRVLKEWERRGLVTLARGTIAIESPKKLEEIAGQGD